MFLVRISIKKRAGERLFCYFISYLCCLNIDISPPSSNSLEANLRKTSCKVIDLSSTDLAYQSFLKKKQCFAFCDKYIILYKLKFV